MDLSQFTPSSALITVILVALAPFVGVMVTSFTKIIVVLSLLRNALGLQQVPPNVVLNGMALVLTVYVMLPVGMDMAERAKGVNNAGGSTAGLMAVADAAKEPLRDFLVKHSSPTVRGQDDVQARVVPDGCRRRHAAVDGAKRTGQGPGGAGDGRGRPEGGRRSGAAGGAGRAARAHRVLVVGLSHSLRAPCLLLN